MNNRRSASVGALPVEKKHFVSRNESASGAVLDVRCACQYFESDLLLPDRINPVESRPTSKQGFLSDMEHGDHHQMHQQHFDNISARSFNMMGRSREFDKISTASFGGRGLVVRSISDATEPEMAGGMMAGGMMAGHRGRQMSIGGMSGGSFGGRDPDAVSIRSGISLRRVSRSPSHADLIVADLNIPTGHVSRGLRRDLPRHITNLPSSSPSSAKFSSPEFSRFDRNNDPMARIHPTHHTTSAGENKENLSGYTENMMPQNKPIDLSMYEDRQPSSQHMEIPRFNLVAPTPTPTMENTSSPDFTRRNVSSERPGHVNWPEGNVHSPSGHSGNIMPQNTSSPDFTRRNVSSERPGHVNWPEENAHSSSGHSGNMIPQNKPIDVSMYEEGGASRRTEEPMVISNLDASMHGHSIYDRRTDHSSERVPHNQWAQENRPMQQQENVMPQNMPIDVSMYADHPPGTITEPNGVSNRTPAIAPRISAPPSAPSFGRRSPPTVDIYDRKTHDFSGTEASQSRQDHHQQQGNVLPQNMPIDVSMYEDRVPGEAPPVNQPMDVDVIEAVVEVRDNIRIDRMSPPLQLNVPDLSPKVENETRIEIRNFAPQPDLRPLDEILADGHEIGNLEQSKDPYTQFNSHSSPPPQGSNLKRQHQYERGMSPESSNKKQLVNREETHEKRLPPKMQQTNSEDFRYRGLDIYDSSVQRGTSQPPMMGSNQSATYSSQIFQTTASPTSTTNDMAQRQYMQYESSPIFDRGLSPPRMDQGFQRGSSPAPSTHKEDRQYAQYESNESTGRSLSPSRMGTHYTDTRQHLQRSSPPASNFHTETMQPTQSHQRASSPIPMEIQQMEPRQLLQRGSPHGVSFKRQTDPSPSSPQRAPLGGTQSLQRASSPSPGVMKAGRVLNFRRSFSLERNKDLDTPLERKPTYSSRFMSMFHSKNTDAAAAKALQEKRRVSADHVQDIKRGKFMSLFHSKTPDQLEKTDVITPSFDKRKLSADHILHMERGRSLSPGKHTKPESSPSRFMSMFHSKPSDPSVKPSVDSPPNNNLEMPTKQQLQVIDPGKPPVKQPKPEGSPSTSRFMGVFKREKVERSEAMSVVEEPSHYGNMSIQKPADKPLLTVKVTETFSLKVDEMDQYSAHPPKSPSPLRQTRMYASSDQLGHNQNRPIQDAISESIAFSADPSTQEPFAPIVLSTSRSSQMHLVAGDRRSYMSSSQADISGSRRSDLNELIPPAPAQIITVGNKKLVSVPIAVPDYFDSEMTISEFMRDEHENQRNQSEQQSRTNLIRAPSEQRLARSKLLQRKSHDRTQSQDRAAASELDSLSLGTRSMTKTVSFNFGEHGSHLDMDSSSNNQLDKKQWLERTYFSRDHEYEPIGEPSTEIKKESTPEPPAQVSALKKELSPAPPSSAVPQADQQELSHSEVPQSALDASDETPSKSDELKEAEELQKDLEDRYFNSAATTSQQESQNDYETQTSQMDSSALDDIPMEAENKKKGFMANAQDKTRKMQAGLKNQAGKIKTKFRSQKKAPSGSPKAATRKRFKAPEFSKMKMPEMKRPEFTKFSKPDMSKFKLPDKFSSLKLTRSKSFKEPSEIDDTTVSGTTPESAAATAPPKKQRFDFSFGTYPRAFRKKPKPQVVEESTVDEPSVIQSTETQPSAESSSTPQGDRGPGPVRSRWADKFSDVSYNDSEGSRYRRFESEQDSSFDRESSMERRMKEVLEDNAKEEAELAMLGVVEQKQFADYDEENRVIHEISKIREREFKRRPMVHQDSDLVSEEGRDIGWTQREAEKNQFLRKAELEAESHLKHHTEKEYHPDTQSTASSKRLVFEEIGSDEFLLRKKGASQEFSMGKQKYLDPNLETEYDKSPNPLELIGSQTASLNGSSIDRIDYGYDVPPPKPRRLSQQQRQRHRYDSENASQIDDYGDDISLSQAGSDYFRHAPPARPLRKGRFKNSQDMSIERTPSIQYDEDDYSLRNKNFVEEEKENIQEEQRNESPMPPQQPPQPPRRRRKQLRDSLEKDSYVNGFGGRSVSNSYLREDNKPEEVIVYRTEHEYNIPLATPENYTDTSVTTRKSKSLSRLGIDDDDRTSHGADSLTLDFAMREENDNKNLNAEELHEKYIIEMMENDGYAVVRKENLPKPTPPARRKKFTRSPGERFATMPHQRKASPSLVAEQKISTGNYSTIGRPTPPRRRSATSLTAVSQKDYGSQDFTDYEEPDLDERPESPRNLQSGDIINKMKYRPLPPPPRPPREKRHLYRDRNGGDDNDDIESRDDRDDRDGGGERIAYHELHEQSSDDYNQQQQENVEVEVSTQTDPLPDDFVCEEFEITEDMKIIEPRRTKTLDEILKEEEEAELERSKQIDEEILARGIQRFREASQRSASERSRASSQAKSLSRPQTPSAILIEKRIPTPVPNANGQTVIEASLTVQPIDDLDLEEEILRREGLYDGSHSKSDEESRYKEEEKQSSRAASEEENARVDEEVQSYTRSSDVESQHQEEEERELEMERQREQDIAFEAERRLREEEEKQKRLQEEEEEEANRRLQEEVEADERLLRELEEEQRYLEEALLRHAEKEKELERRIREEEEEEERKRILEEIAIDQRLRPDSQSEEHESYDEDQNERLKSEDSYELKSEVSEEKETTPLPSPSSTQQPPQVEQEVLVSQVKKLLLTTPPKEESQEREKTLSPPPTAPPRKRSTADHTESLSVAEQPAPIPFTGVMPSHLSIADLEVERLRVHALQAGQIMVSHLHGAQIQAEELECRSGNLVVKNIELPPGFIEDIVERVRSTEREHAQASTQTIAEARTQTETDSIPPPPLPSREPEIPPVRPPPPSAAHFLQLQRDQDESPRSVHVTDYHLQTIPPIGFYNHLHAGDDGELAAGPPPVYRRRRHLRRRDSSSEEEHQRRRSRSIRPEQPPQSVAQAGRQFISACSLPLVNIITQLTNALRPNNDNNKDQVQPRNISTAVVLLVVMALSFVIYLLTGRNIHHHHWDYFNPPGNDGRLS
ncbi:titin homolog isoform X1 [Eupeodes corollae]|uniref:titin homolog isoform X1 n=1 Tax=Eupeodes corollae TaxID=290404 RepID=UPI00248FC6AA|nr:titin homolog isoform X1 [Eupeodes corollae]